MGGPEARLGFPVLLLMVWFSGTPGGEFRRGTCGILETSCAVAPPPPPLSLPLAPLLLSGSPGQNKVPWVKQ